MSSIPGPPTPGSKVPVVIRKVQLNSSCGLIELWVNMDDELQQSYEQMRSQIQVPEKRFNGSEGKPEDLCLVCIDDTWHRARILSNQSDAYEVFLIDHGWSHRTTSAALAWAKSNSFVLPPEVESCVLANVLSIENTWPEKASNFLLSLPGRKFTGQVQHVLMPDRIIFLDLPVVSWHVRSLGVTKEMPADEFKSLAQKCLVLLKGEIPKDVFPTQKENSNSELLKQHGFFHPELLTGTYVTVKVTEVTDELNVFCKLTIFSKAAKSLTEELQQHDEESSEFGGERLQTCGDFCAARGRDGKWYRSILKQNIHTNDNTAEVFFVDEGRTELVPAGDVKPLPEQFLRMPVVTYLCSLTGTQKTGRDWTTEEREYLKSLLLNQPMVARFDHKVKSSDVYEVTLFSANAACINTCFLERTGLTSLSTSVPDRDVLFSFVSSLKAQQEGDLRKKVVKNVNSLTDETSPSRRTSVTNSGANHGFSSDLKATAAGEPRHPGPVLVPEEQDTCDDTVITVGTRVGVKVSYIESPQKFWCQITEREDALRRLTRDLQKHYGSVNLQPLIQSVCVARNPDDNMWHRARITASSRSPVVEVVFIDYGRTCMVPLRDVCPIDPAFLQLKAQAFPCCLSNSSNATHLHTAEFQRFVDLGASSETGLTCVVEEVTHDEDGLPLNVVDIETACDSACKFLSLKLQQSEARVEIPALVPSNRYNISTYGIEIGVKEKMWITSSETVNHFYCQLDRNAALKDQVEKDVVRHLGQKFGPNHPLELGSACLAKYTNEKWYRGQVVEVFPRPKVHFVDYGDTLTVNGSDICPFPSQANVARSTPVLAILLGLSGIPEKASQKVNQWFSYFATGEEFTISVVARGEKGKLLVELFEGSVNVNEMVRKKISQTRQHKETHSFHGVDQQLPDRAEWRCGPNGDTNWTKQNGAGAKKETTVRDDVVMSPTSTFSFSAPPTNQPTLERIPEDKENVTDMKEPSPLTCPDDDANLCTYKRPNIIQDRTEEAYATCIVGPHFFWCQQVNTAELQMLTELAQAAGRARRGVSPESLQPGSPCLALFSSDDQWYRAQVVRKTEASLHVVFIDFGNETELELTDVAALPSRMLEMAPLAFLCTLDGFSQSSGSWNEDVHDVFYNLLVDKPLKVTVVSSESNSEFAVPKYTVKIQCNSVDINGLMEKYWKSGNLSAELPNNVMDQTSPREIQTESKITEVPEGKKSYMYREPEISKSKTATVYASCIVDPFFFWCQDTNTEALNRLLPLAQEAGRTQEGVRPEALAPGSPCLALFSTDNKWYRAQVIRKVGDVFHVAFIDYGNESEVNIKDVRSLPESLLEMAPQAFLCRLNGFDKPKGSWAHEVHDDFYSHLVDKPLSLTQVSVERHPETTIPQYSVEIKCEDVNVNALMGKHWKKLDLDESLAEHMISVNLNDTETEEEQVEVQTGTSFGFGGVKH